MFYDHFSARSLLAKLGREVLVQKDSELLVQGEMGRGVAGWGELPQTDTLAYSTMSPFDLITSMLLL